MLADEKALRRGLLTAFGAAMLQGMTAIALDSIAALLLHATAQRMTEAAHIIEMASYATITLLGLSLCCTKCAAFIGALRSTALWLCSGAILVLIFALSQSIFPAGLASVAAMSVGTAMTTGALAS